MGHAFELCAAESSVVLEDVVYEVLVFVGEHHLIVADIVACDESVERLVGKPFVDISVDRSVHPSLELALEHGVTVDAKRPRLDVIEKFLQLQMYQRHLFVRGEPVDDIVCDIMYAVAHGW